MTSETRIPRERHTWEAKRERKEREKSEENEKRAKGERKQNKTRTRRAKRTKRERRERKENDHGEHQKAKAKKHKKKKRRRDDGGADTSCIAARALAGGFVRASGLLPPEAAAAAADLVRQAPEEAWRSSSAKSDAKAHGKKTNSTRHSYAVGDGGVDAPDADVEALVERVLESVAPSEGLRARRLVPRLQLGRYGRGDHIVKHDDAAVVEIDGVPHERRIALVYYLPGEPTWDAARGGLFVDHASGRRLAPVPSISHQN